MVRKVGFGDDKKPVSVADAHLDRFRARARAQKAQKSAATVEPLPKVKRRWFTILFLTLWLCFWTVGIFIAGVVVSEGEGGWFLIIWLTVATIGWLSVMAILINHLRGKK